MIDELKPYDEYKQINLLWLDKVPKHWKTKKIKYLFKERTEKGHPDEPLLAATQTKGVIPKQLYETRTVTASKDLHLLKLVEIGDFVISLRSFQGGIEYAYYKGIISPAYTIMVSQNDIQKDYFRHFAKSKPFLELLKMSVTGIREGQNINYDFLKNSIIPIPPKEEQDQIVRYLDYKLAKIAKFIKAKKKLIAVLKEQKQAIINEAVTKGINTNVKMKPSGIEWLGDVPEGWRVRRMKDLGKFINGYAFPSYVFTDSGIRVMKISNIQTMKIDWTDESFVNESYYNELVNFRVLYGDLVLALTRPIISTGIKAAFVYSNDKILLNQRNALFRAKQNLSLTWLYYVMNNSNFIKTFDQKIDKTGQQPNISTIDIQNISIPLPSISVQNDVIDYMKSKTEIIDKAIDKIEKEIDLITEYRTSLISDVVTGKVDVRGIEIEEINNPIEEIEEIEEIEDVISPVDGEEE